MTHTVKGQSLLVAWMILLAAPTGWAQEPARVTIGSGRNPSVKVMKIYGAAFMKTPEVSASKNAVTIKGKPFLSMPLRFEVPTTLAERLQTEARVGQLKISTGLSMTGKWGPASSHHVGRVTLAMPGLTVSRATPEWGSKGTFIVTDSEGKHILGTKKPRSPLFEAGAALGGKTRFVHEQKGRSWVPYTVKNLAATLEVVK